MISPVSWPSYENGDHKDQQSPAIFQYLSPFEHVASPSNGTPSSETSGTLGVPSGSHEFVGYSSHQSTNEHPVSSPDGDHNMTSQDLHQLLDLSSMDHDMQSFSHPDKTSSENSQEYGQGPDFLQDLFHHYSVHSAMQGQTQQNHIDSVLLGHNQSQQIHFSNTSIPGESPIPSTMNNTSTISVESSNIGVSVTTEEFTPLLSPAVTPFDTVNPGIMPTSDFTMPVPYFDVASSPSLAAHNDIPLRKDDMKGARRNTRSGTTPVMGPTLTQRQSSSRVAKMSPLIRPSRRSSTKVALSATASPVISTNRSLNSSCPESTLSDAALPPPQTKPTRPQEISILPKSKRPTAQDSSAATPASLMNLPESKEVEAVDASEAELHLKNAVRVTKNIAQQASARRPSKGSGLSSPSLSPGKSRPPLLISRARSQTNLMLSPKTTVPIGSSSAVLKPKIAIAPASSASSSPVWRQRPTPIAASPSLNPRMSPFISPKDPVPHPRSNSVGNPSTDLSALLASKSNYQNIVEGNHNQLGLSYPEDMSAGLTSKRTSHKLAEQGRRNRINSALTDLGKVLSPEFQAGSKASIVEMAIQYITSLQTELSEAKKRLSQYEDVDDLEQASTSKK